MQNADPTGEIQPDSREMLQLEDQCYMMGPLIDQQLQKIDYTHAILDVLNIKIIEAFQMYNNLMKESINKTTNLTQPIILNNNISSNVISSNQGNFVPFVSAPSQSNNSGSLTINGANRSKEIQFNSQIRSGNFQNYNINQQYALGLQPLTDINSGLQNQINLYVPDLTQQQMNQFASLPPPS